jgi:heat shock protein beta
MEGNVDFRALLYLPQDVPYELTRDMFAQSARSMRLYVKRVFINDKFEDLLPRWLLFLRGVVDSDDLPLNVGREILQQSRSLRIIKQRLVKKSIEMMTDLADRNATQYRTFWKNFGKYVKVGIIEDEKHREELAPLCRFFTSRSNSTQVSLAEYVGRMAEGQTSIYYVVGDTRAQAAKSPALERLQKKGYEVSESALLFAMPRS